MLTDEEIMDIRNRANLNYNRQIDPLPFARDVIKAVLAKAMPISKQEPVCEVEHISYDGGKTYVSELYFKDGNLDLLPDGTKLYADPQPVQAAAIPEWMPIETMPTLESVQVYCGGAECVGIAHKTSSGQIVMPEPQAIGYDSLTHWKPLSEYPKPE